MTLCLGWAAAGLGATHLARNSCASIVLPRVETRLRQKLRLSAAARGWQPWSQDECSKGARAARGVGPGPPSEAPALLGSSQKCSLCLKWEVAEDWVLEPTVSAHGGWSWVPLD